MKRETEVEFIITDGCAWEGNNQADKEEAFHAIEVIDSETGQMRMIKSGSRIKFVSGQISPIRSQQKYNELNAPKT
mgnify:FL=1